MSILITGGSSTLGKHLKQILPEAVYVSSVNCNLTNYQDTLDLFERVKPDVIVHLAALVGGIVDNVTRPVDYLEQNVLINTNTIKAAYNVGVAKLIALSSTCIYPDIVAHYPMDETVMFSGAPTLTNFGYAYSKRCMIAQIHAYNSQYGTNYCYITPSNLYSELDEHKQGKAHYVAALLDKIVEQDKGNSTEIRLLGTGRPLRQFTYAGDIAEIIKLMIQNNLYESFNVSNPEIYSIAELARLTLDSLDKQHWSIVYEHPDMDGQYRKDVSIVRFREYFPNFTFTKFADGIKKVYNKKIKQHNYE